MNYGISVLFRAIPLVMALFCLFYGGFIFLHGGDQGSLTAGPVIFFLGSICLALFATAATIIRQIIGTYNRTAKYLLPSVGYIVALFTLVFGIVMFKNYPQYFVAGHVVAGLGLIAACVSTAATSSTKFSLIPKNSAQQPPKINPDGFSVTQELIFEGVVLLISIVAWVWALLLLSKGGDAQHFVAGSVMGGIACVCTSLIALVGSIVRQVRGIYSKREKRMWIGLVLSMGSLAIVWGVLTILIHWDTTVDFVGFIQIGLGLICLSISSKVILLAKIWHGEFPLAKRIPLIPVLTALCCLFMGAFLFEEVMYNDKYFVPARVLMGFGAICFTLFSIVSILESGTSKK